jgi:hypothetical protein
MATVAETETTETTEKVRRERKGGRLIENKLLLAIDDVQTALDGLDEQEARRVLAFVFPKYLGGQYNFSMVKPRGCALTQDSDRSASDPV